VIVILPPKTGVDSLGANIRSIASQHSFPFSLMRLGASAETLPGLKNVTAMRIAVTLSADSLNAYN
jgi:hypothetical protein